MYDSSHFIADWYTNLVPGDLVLVSYCFLAKPTKLITHSSSLPVTILSRPPIHFVPGCCYFHGITLRDNSLFHPFTDLGAGENLRITGKKNTKAAR